MLAPKRTTRREPGRARLMPRELTALAFIAEAQPVATSAYREFLGVSLSVAQRSLRKLRNLGLVRVHVVALELPSHFTITRKAARLLAEGSTHSAETHRVPRGLGKHHLTHHDGAVLLCAALHHACRQHGDITLSSFQFEDTIRRTLCLTRHTQVSDAVLTLQCGTGSALAWAVEIDQATETVPYIVENKAKPYAALQSRGAPLAGVTTWHIACIVPSEARLKRLVTALYEAGIPDGQWYFAVRSDLTANTVLTTAWRTVRTTPGGEQAELVIEPPLPAPPVSTACPNRSNGRHT